MSSSGHLNAAVVITTRNRKEELRRAINSCLRQSVPLEVLVIDDGSTDGTAEMVLGEFSQVRLERSDTSRGYISQRNTAAQLTTADIVFSIDDDAEFQSTKTVEQTLQEFDVSFVGGVAIPYSEPKKNDSIFQIAPSSEGIWVTDTYRGTAHALRRNLFLSLGGYREHLIHQGEESDYCFRMLEAGYLVRLGTADPIIHHESPKRDLKRMDYYGPRNAILFVWQNVPGPQFILHMLATTWKCLMFTGSPARLWNRIAGIVNGYRSCFLKSTVRKPVSHNTYLKHRTLKSVRAVLISGPSERASQNSKKLPYPEFTHRIHQVR